MEDATSEPTPQETRRQRSRRTRRRAGLYAWMFVLAAVVIVLVALAVQNTLPVEVSWVFGTSEVPLVWLIIFSAILGWLAGIVTGTVIRHSTRRR
ncbi:MAG TPA: LapA family protein [Euzebyales bacterium]|nr:LapA family protein [Euzebyales bacterium]